MQTLRRAVDRGHGQHGWLDTWHTFSFADYFDPAQRGFRSLRVINEDRVAPGRGFGEHPHRDMEIISLVLSGALAHKDSLGHAATLQPGELQRITAGTGVEHSEFNPSATEPVHFYQIWLFPEQKGLPPGYEQKAFDPAGRQDQWQVVASRTGRDGSLTIWQDAELFWAALSPGRYLDYALRPERHAWVQVLRGSARLNDVVVQAGDGMALSPADRLTLATEGLPAEVLLFDLA